MYCTINSDTCNLIDNKKLCCIIDIHKDNNKEHIEVDWKYYREFYGGGTRNMYNTNRSHCKDTSMISMALYIINYTFIW